mmetsp:Transcript_42913/g.135216  ORF Transcript_42913/g.135216 Transcript_42913/m.135216 type:complete len:316 (+) Transcript_42913:327-1274(+)
MPKSMPTKRQLLTMMLSPAVSRDSTNNSCVTRNIKATMANEMNPTNTSGFDFMAVPMMLPRMPANASTREGPRTKTTCLSLEVVMFRMLAQKERPKKPISMQVAIDMHQPVPTEAVKARPTNKPSTAASTKTANTKGHEIFSATLSFCAAGLQRRKRNLSVWPWMWPKVFSKMPIALRAPTAEVAPLRLSPFCVSSSVWNCKRFKLASSNGSGKAKVRLARSTTNIMLWTSLSISSREPMGTATTSLPTSSINSSTSPLKTSDTLPPDSSSATCVTFARLSPFSSSSSSSSAPPVKRPKPNITSTAITKPAKTAR